MERLSVHDLLFQKIASNKDCRITTIVSSVPKINQPVQFISSNKGYISPNSSSVFRYVIAYFDVTDCCDDLYYVTLELSATPLPF